MLCLICTYFQDGKSALYYAVSTKKLELVKPLVVGGIDINLQDQVKGKLYLKI